MKPWFLSKTIIGAIATLVGQGLGLDAEGIQQLTGELVSLAGAALVIYGRIKATEQITITARRKVGAGSDE